MGGQGDPTILDVLSATRKLAPSKLAGRVNSWRVRLTYRSGAQSSGITSLVTHNVQQVAVIFPQVF